MTDADFTPDDEIVSAYLDGEATPAERARVEREPALQARLAAFRSAADLVGRPPRSDPDAREAILGRARDASSALAVPSSPPGHGEQEAGSAPIHDLHEARTRRRRAVLIGAAAVVAVLVLGAGLLPRLVDDGDEVTTAADRASERAPEEPATDTGETGESAPSDSSDEEAAAPSTQDRQQQASDLPEGPPLPELGDFATRDQLDTALTDTLVTALRDRSGGSLAAPSRAASLPCVTAVMADDGELSELAYAATAALGGAALEVLVFWTDPASSANGPMRIYLVDPSTCAPIPGGVETIVR